MNSPKHRTSTSPAHAGFAVFRVSIALFFALVISGIAVAESSYSAVYNLQADGISLGKLERSLEWSADGSLVLKTRSFTTGFWKLFVDDTITEESRFVITDGKVIPGSYHYSKSKKGKLREERVEFDTNKGEIISSSTDGVQHFPFTGIESDKLLYQFLIRAALKRGEVDFDLPVIDRRELRSYQFQSSAPEMLTTNLGELEVVRVERINEAKRKTTLWFATALDYLPVKIVQDAGDHNYSSAIISATITP
jgi:hypothetical protein